jgi:hypothetical protein
MTLRQKLDSLAYILRVTQCYRARVTIGGLRMLPLSAGMPFPFPLGKSLKAVKGSTVTFLRTLIQTFWKLGGLPVWGISLQMYKRR